MTGFGAKHAGIKAKVLQFVRPTNRYTVELIEGVLLYAKWWSGILGGHQRIPSIAKMPVYGISIAW